MSGVHVTAYFSGQAVPGGSDVAGALDGNDSLGELNRISDEPGSLLQDTTYIGCRQDRPTVRGFTGEIAAILCYDRNLTVAEYNDIVGYLGGKY
ncbi:hypothetical protein, partial [Tritonibacter sp. SIMBA_163]|uniref:hypothetical protein n=1 Tax=Tritonibacter sp. SIMBA_163 TaxID=3080868 RepID=UPI00397FDC57